MKTPLVTRSSVVARSTSALEVAFPFEFCYCSVTGHKLRTAVTENGSPPDASSEFRTERAALIKSSEQAIDVINQLFHCYTTHILSSSCMFHFCILQSFAMMDVSIAITGCRDIV